MDVRTAVTKNNGSGLPYSGITRIDGDALD